VKFTEKGEVTIEAKWTPESTDAGRLEVTVADTGVGMSEETRCGLFAPFTQADHSTTRRFGGTGLGLAISKQLVGLMGGEIGVESELGKGSMFHFWVPFEIAQSSTLASDADGDAFDRGDDLTSCPGARILLVEDNAISRLVAARTLSRAGHHVTEARTGREALELHERSEFDLVLMDCQMPEMDGYEASRQIRRREQGRRRTPIIATTATTMAGDREKCLAAGMDEFIAKPAKLQDLTKVVARVLRESDRFTRRTSMPLSATLQPKAGTSAGARC
jgi:CheY-like chemotaxis protein